jgi:transposase
MHRSAPLALEGRRRLVERCQTRPISHIAAEMGISRVCASKWVNRYRRYGDIRLLDRSSAPHRQPTITRGTIVSGIEALRRTGKWPAARIAFEPNTRGTQISRRTVSRYLKNLGLNRRRFLDLMASQTDNPDPSLPLGPGRWFVIDVKSRKHEKVGCFLRRSLAQATSD